jgi:cation transport ATPase
MNAISNGKLLLRVMTAAIGVGLLGFICGFFGPLYLLRNAGVGPITAFFAAPVGLFIGTATAVQGCAAGLTGRRYAYRMLAVAAIFAAATLTFVMLQ